MRCSLTCRPAELHATRPNQPCSSVCGTSAVAIDNKIEQAMDLVKGHLMLAVREEVEVLKERIKELWERNSELRRENTLLKSLTNLQQLQTLSAQLSPPPEPTAGRVGTAGTAGTDSRVGEAGAVGAAGTDGGVDTAGGADLSERQQRSPDSPQRDLRVKNPLNKRLKDVFKRQNPSGSAAVGSPGTLKTTKGPAMICVDLRDMVIPHKLSSPSD
ncbi:hypothetical protein MHYP_G00230960 [Metynnis hypsauchen]